MQKVGPAILDLEISGLPLSVGLIEEDKIATVVEIPGHGAFRKDCRIGQRRTRRILAEPGGIDDQRAGLQARENRVVLGIGRCEYVFDGNFAFDLLVNALDLVEARLAAIGDDDARGHVLAARGAHQVPGDGDGRAAGAHAEQLGAGAFEIAPAEKAVDRKARGNRVLGMADELAAALGDAARFVHQRRVRVDDVEQIAAGVEEVYLVGRDQRAHRQRVVADEFDRLPIESRVVVNGEVDTPDLGIPKSEIVRPCRKDLHDRAFPGRDPDEVEGRPGGRFIDPHVRTSEPTHMSS